MEPPGTAPGSDPLITSAFMSIVPKGTHQIYSKGRLGSRLDGFALVENAWNPSLHAGQVAIWISVRLNGRLVS